MRERDREARAENAGILASRAFSALAAGAFAFLAFAFAAIKSLSREDGLGYALVGAVLVLRASRGPRRRLRKRRPSFPRAPAGAFLAAAALGGAALSAPIAARSDAPAPPILPALCLYLAAVACLSLSRVLDPPFPDKLVLRLDEFGLNEGESEAVRLRVMGLSAKEIAFDRGVALSTVRNRLCSSYRKLGVGGSEGLAALAERYTLE